MNGAEIVQVVQVVLGKICSRYRPIRLIQRSTRSLRQSLQRDRFGPRGCSADGASRRPETLAEARGLQADPSAHLWTGLRQQPDSRRCEWVQRGIIQRAGAPGSPPRRADSAATRSPKFRSSAASPRVLATEAHRDKCVSCGPTSAVRSSMTASFSSWRPGTKSNTGQHLVHGREALEACGFLRGRRLHPSRSPARSRSSARYLCERSRYCESLHRFGSRGRAG